MRMSNQMREILNDMNAQRNLLDQAIKDRDPEKAKAAQTEIEKLNALYTAAETAFLNERALEREQDQDDDDSLDEKPSSEKPAYDSKLFYKALTARGALTESERSLIAEARRKYDNYFSEFGANRFTNSLSEGVKENGGYTVPDDLSQEIFESIKTRDSVRNLVYVENVTSTSGTRIYKSGDANRLYNTAEYEEIKELDNPKFGTVTYNQKKFAGITPISNELLNDSFVNFQSEITAWLADAARVTENRQILYGAGGDKHCQGIISTQGAYREITAPSSITIDFLRKVKFSLRSPYRASAMWVMNTDAFLLISELKDGNGRSYIQPDPINAEQYILLGSPMYILDDIETDENKTVILYGDLKTAYRMFSRQDFGITFTDIGAGAFETDSIRARGIERFDGRIMDNNALVIVRDLSVTPTTVTTPEKDFGAASAITAESLAYQSKTGLLEFAEDMGIAGVNSTMTKSNIITAILSALEGDDEDTEDDTGSEPGVGA